MRGRIPNRIKEKAKEDVAKYGSELAYQYACYNTSWSNPDPDDIRLVSAIFKIIEEEQQNIHQITVEEIV